VIEAAATLWREFDASLLPHAVRQEPDAVDAAIRAATALGLLAPLEAGLRVPTRR